MQQCALSPKTLSILLLRPSKSWWGHWLKLLWSTLRQKLRSLQSRGRTMARHAENITPILYSLRRDEKKNHRVFDYLGYVIRAWALTNRTADISLMMTTNQENKWPDKKIFFELSTRGDYIQHFDCHVDFEWNLICYTIRRSLENLFLISTCKEKMFTLNELGHLYI